MRSLRPSPAMVVACIALFVALGGSAVALSGHDTVQSDDLGPGAQVKAPDVADDAVNGADVKNGSLRQADLGVRMRSARQPDYATTGNSCGTTKDTWDQCVTVSFTVPRPQRLLLVASGEWLGLNVAKLNEGRCMFAGANFEDLGSRTFGESHGPEGASYYNLAMDTVTGVIDKGTYGISLYCRDISPPGGNVDVRNTELSVVGIGDG